VTGFLSAVGGLVIATLLSGCAIGGVDKTGSDTIELQLATIDGLVDSSGHMIGPATFVQALSKVSDGRIQVRVTTSYSGGTATSESELVRAIAAGDVDGGWPATRAFAGAGIAGLAAIEAPMTLTSLAAVQELAVGEGAELAMARLAGTGIRGLGLVPGSLRRPFGVDRFLLSTRDWKGIRFHSSNSPVQDEAIRTLGATPVSVAAAWRSMAAAGNLGGIESDVSQYFANGFSREAGWVASNIVLWPKMFVLSINADRWQGLSDQQRGWIQAAADRALQASIGAEYAEDHVARELCLRGVRFQSADPGQILELKQAVKPVIDRLAGDPAEATLLGAVQSAAVANPMPDAITVSVNCIGEDSAPAISDIPTTIAPIPDGTYRKQITEEDVADAGLTNNDGITGIWTLEVSDGHWSVSCRPLSSTGIDCGWADVSGELDSGTFMGDQTTAWMMSDRSGVVAPALQWSLDGRDLVFSGSNLSRGFETILKTYVRID
jgi:TRAP-type C4-dicarboxylate transport system substrate-binding protein